MLRHLALPFIVCTGLLAQVLPLLHQVVHLPFFRYPALAKMARIQGKVDMVLVVEKGLVVSVHPANGEKEFKIPQLSNPAVEEAKRISFFQGTSGEFELHLIFKLTDKEGPTTRMEVNPVNNTITIETDKPEFCALPAKTP